ncbi:MAG: glycosyltransferase family 4 protein [Gemmatimonadota bacterium]|nr:glycosyltransferase family 4 protein [Gemmatimonadota bacterium]
MIGQKGVPATYGGIERHVHELAGRLAERGVRVDAHCRSHYTPVDAVLPGVRLVRLPALNTKHLDAVSHTTLASMHALFSRADIVHYHALGPSTLAWIPRLAGKKIVVTVHGLDWRREKWNRAASWALRRGEWTAAHLPHATIVVSRTLLKHFRVAAGERAHYIPNGTPIPPPAPEDGARARGLEPGRYVLFVGRLVPEKGLHLLLDAHRSHIPDWTLAVAGDAHFTDSYARSCRESAHDGVRFLGGVYGSELESVWAHAALVVIPSALEGLSIALLEAMSHGRAVLGSDIPENTEVLKGAGETFRSGDAEHLGARLSELLQMPDHLAQLGALARERIREEYDWERVADQTLEIYRSVTGGAGEVSA